MHWGKPDREKKKIRISFLPQLHLHVLFLLQQITYARCALEGFWGFLFISRGSNNPETPRVLPLSSEFSRPVSAMCENHDGLSERRRLRSLSVDEQETELEPSMEQDEEEEEQEEEQQEEEEGREEYHYDGCTTPRRTKEIMVTIITIVIIIFKDYLKDLISLRFVEVDSKFCCSLTFLTAGGA